MANVPPRLADGAGGAFAGRDTEHCEAPQASKATMSLTVSQCAVLPVTVNSIKPNREAISAIIHYSFLILNSDLAATQLNQNLNIDIPPSRD
ncbi:MAG: hypothetical protein IJ766_00395 [Clostridia bacterium]|nr:hypothetical protein [Clostridia bacterium]